MTVFFVEILITITFRHILDQVTQVFLQEQLLQFTELLEIIGTIEIDFGAVYCAGDWKSQTVCLCKKPHEKSNPGNGKMSPDALLCNTVGDQLKLKDSLSKVYGVSIKDRGAILSTGPLADGAYWLNSESQWITSSFYRKDIPKWMVDFHKKHPVSSYSKRQMGRQNIQL